MSKGSGSTAPWSAERRANLSRAMIGNGMVPIGMLRNKGAYVLEKVSQPDEWRQQHRLVMEKDLGRPLHHEQHPNGNCVGECEVVHHANEDKRDNRIVNLELMTKREHDRYHAVHRKVRVA